MNVKINKRLVSKYILKIVSRTEPNGLVYTQGVRGDRRKSKKYLKI